MTTRPPLYQPQSVADHVILVTGATAGIGEAIAWRFAEAGSKLILVGRRIERLEKLKADLTGAYPGLPAVHIEQLDVQDLKKVADLPNALPESHRDVDILVNNAGLALGVNTVADNDIDEAQQMLNTNVTAVIALTKAFVPGMLKRGRGHLITIGSIAGHEAYQGGSVYCASKFAVGAFTTAARHDLVATPIRVTNIAPGACNTEFSLVRLGDQATADKVYDNLVPLVAADVADNVIYAATRPAHVQIADMIVWPTNQAAAKLMARVGPTLGAP